MLPTVVVANMAPGGPASRSNHLNIGDQVEFKLLNHSAKNIMLFLQIIAINGISLVGLPLAAAQQNIKVFNYYIETRQLRILECKKFHRCSTHGCLHAASG